MEFDMSIFPDDETKQKYTNLLGDLETVHLNKLLDCVTQNKDYNILVCILAINPEEIDMSIILIPEDEPFSVIRNIYDVLDAAPSCFVCQNTLHYRKNITQDDIKWMATYFDSDYADDDDYPIDMLVYCDENLISRPFFEKFLLRLLINENSRKNIQDELDRSPFQMDSYILSCESIKILEKYDFKVFPSIDKSNMIDERVLGRYVRDNDQDEWMRDQLMLYFVEPNIGNICEAIKHKNYKLAEEWFGKYKNNKDSMFKAISCLLDKYEIVEVEWFVDKYKSDMKWELYDDLMTYIKAVKLAEKLSKTNPFARCNNNLSGLKRNLIYYINDEVDKMS